jgi:cytochrome P450 family 9
MLAGKDWRDMRPTLSPLFTGNKLRQMFQLILHVGKQSTETLNKEIGVSGKVLEMRDFLSKFAIDVIATCAFGLEVDSFKNPDNYFQKFANSAVFFLQDYVLLSVIKIFLFFSWTSQAFQPALSWRAICSFLNSRPFGK